MGKVKNFFKGVGKWFKNHIPTRRRIIQVYAALLTNANLKGFFEGQIYQNTAEVNAATKNLCAPGLNCYSCPGAVAACPLGSLQNSLGSSKTTTPYYILGILALLGLSLARTICGFLCPFGLAQELLYKIKTPKLKKSAFTRLLSYLKYLLLIVLVIAVPLIYHNVPAFCKYICPAGTFEGSVGLLANKGNSDFYSMLGYLFSWKFILLVLCVVLCIFVFRGFCRFFCPLGAIYGFFNRIALIGVKLEKSKCIDCGMCISKCKMDIREVGDHECINCGECIPVCPTKAISWKGGKLFLEPTSYAISAAQPADTDSTPSLATLISGGTTAEIDESAVQINNNEAVEISATEKEAQAIQSNAEEVLNKCANKPLYQRKKSAKILEIVAWALAGAILIAALVYYNTLPPVRKAFGKKLDDFTAPTYQTAYAGDEYTLYDNDSKPTVLVFWSSKNDTSIEYLSSLGEKYDELSKDANLVAVHVINGKTEEEVEEKIVESGLNNLRLPILQDTDELGLYDSCGGTGAFPMTVFVNIRSEIHTSNVGEMTEEEILTQIDATRSDTVYEKGDRMYDFTVNTYHSAYKESTISTADLRGKVIVLNFWYISCGPCVEELPYIEEVQEKFGDSVVTIALHKNNHEVPQVQSFIGTFEANINKTDWSDWNIVFGQDVGADKYFTMYGGKAAYPVTAIIDTNGYLVEIIQGPVINAGKDLLTPAIEEALSAKN